MNRRDLLKRLAAIPLALVGSGVVVKEVVASQKVPWKASYNPTIHYTHPSFERQNIISTRTEIGTVVRRQYPELDPNRLYKWPDGTIATTDEHFSVLRVYGIGKPAEN